MEKRVLREDCLWKTERLTIIMKNLYIIQYGIFKFPSYHGPCMPNFKISIFYPLNISRENLILMFMIIMQPKKSNNIEKLCVCRLEFLNRFWLDFIWFDNLRDLGCVNSKSESRFSIRVMQKLQFIAIFANFNVILPFLRPCTWMGTLCSFKILKFLPSPTHKSLFWVYRPSEWNKKIGSNLWETA